MTPKLALFFIIKNSDDPTPVIAERLKMPRSTIYAILNHTLHSIKNEMATTILQEFENLRERPTLKDPSLLLPANIPLQWRFTTTDGNNTHTLHNSEYPPVYGPLGWAVPAYINAPQLTINPALFKIPAAREPYNEYLYQRDRITGLWVKTNFPTTVPDIEQSTPTQEDFDNFADNIIREQERQPQNKLSNMLENNPYINKL